MSLTSPASSAPEFGHRPSIVVVGAGLAGLTAARLLQQAGYPVSVLEKSRGTGGRLNTRREGILRLDRGVRFWHDAGPLSAQLLRHLEERGILGPWAAPVYRLGRAGEREQLPGDRYVSPTGLSAIAKALAADLPVAFNRRAVAIAAPDGPGGRWTVQCDRPRPDAAAEPPDRVEAGALLLTAPAPQALTLLENVDFNSNGLEALCDDLEGATYAPGLTVTAGYGLDADLDAVPWQGWGAIKIEDDRDLAWLSREDRKQAEAPEPAIVLQTTGAGAEPYLELDGDALAAAGPVLLSRASHLTGLGLDRADWIRVHRWRYARATVAVGRDCLVLDDDRRPPLVCAGDWCLGHNIEAALQSGVAAAKAIALKLDHRAIDTDLSLLF